MQPALCLAIIPIWSFKLLAAWSTRLTPAAHEHCQAVVQQMLCVPLQSLFVLCECTVVYLGCAGQGLQKDKKTVLLYILVSVFSKGRNGYVLGGCRSSPLATLMTLCLSRNDTLLL